MRCFFFSFFYSDPGGIALSLFLSLSSSLCDSFLIFRYYLSGNDAYRMKLLFPLPPPMSSTPPAATGVEE